MDPTTHQAIVDAVIETLKANGALNGSGILTSLLGTAGGGALILTIIGFLLKGAIGNHAAQHKAEWRRIDEHREKIQDQSEALVEIKTTMPFLRESMERMDKNIEEIKESKCPDCPTTKGGNSET